MQGTGMQTDLQGTGMQGTGMQTTGNSAGMQGTGMQDMGSMGVEGPGSTGMQDQSLVERMADPVAERKDALQAQLIELQAQLISIFQAQLQGGIAPLGGMPVGASPASLAPPGGATVGATPAGTAPPGGAAVGVSPAGLAPPGGIAVGVKPAGMPPPTGETVRASPAGTAPPGCAIAGAKPGFHCPPSRRVCILGDAAHCEEAFRNLIPFKSVDDLKRLHKNKKLIRKLARSFGAFIASPAVISQIPQLLGRGLYAAGKFPIPADRDKSVLSQAMDILDLLRRREATRRMKFAASA